MEIVCDEIKVFCCLENKEQKVIKFLDVKAGGKG